MFSYSYLNTRFPFQICYVNYVNMSVMFVVRYHFCSKTVASKMVRFSRTVAPANESNLTKQEGKCTDPNSITKNNKKLFGVCLSNGEWNITDNSTCLCNYGYELTNGSFNCKG